MKCLLDRFSSDRVSDVLWITDSHGKIDVAKLKLLLARVDSSDWRGKRVAIGSLPVLEYVCALVFLDGLAQSILLLPDEDDQPTREFRLVQAKIDLVLEGRGLEFIELLGECNNASSNDVAQPTLRDRQPVRQTTWLLPTSGTTGSPKLIAHTFESLTRSMTTRRIGSAFTWGSLYSMRRFAGLQVLLQSWMSCTPLILNEEGADLDGQLSRFTDLGCSALSATPSMWRKLALHHLFDRMTLKQITLGGEIVDQAVLDMLSKRFPDARVTHIYASTEAGVGFAVHDKLAGFPASFLQDPPLGVGMRIDDQNHLWFETKLMQPLEVSTGNGWIDSGDVVEIQADRVRFLGRANGSINVGGNKVMPEEIEQVIKELPEVAFVQVRARNSAMLGSLVEASISPAPGSVIDADFKKQVITHCRSRLDGFKVPAFIVAADVIELTASGKLPRMEVE